MFFRPTESAHTLKGGKTTRKFVVTVVLVSLVVGLFVGGAFAQGKKPKIAWCPAISDPFYYMIGKGIADKCKELGLELFVAEYPKAWGPEVQVPILEAVAARGDIDVIVTGPTSKDALIAPLKRIHDMGIEIITVDTYIGDGDYSKPNEYSFPLTFIGTGNFQGGVEIAHRLAEMIGKKGQGFCRNNEP